MGIFDFIFGNNKKEEEARLERERQEKLKREREEKARIEAEKRRKEQESSSIEPFVFKSNCHQRYESGEPKLGLQECIRTIRVEKNTNGCSGYKLSPGKGYIVKIFNDDLGKPNMSDKPMRVVRRTADVVELRGFPIEAQTPFGWEEIDMSDYGLLVYYKAGKVEKCRLHMYDRDIYIEYGQKKIQPKIQETRAVSPISEELSNLAGQANFAYNTGNPQASQLLSDLLERCWGGRGHLLLEVDSKDCMCVGLAFANMSISVDWNDEDFNSVAAENAFYCLSKNLLVEHNSFAAPALFTLLLNHSNLLKDKLIATHCTMAQEQVGMPIGMMLGGNPFNAPHLQDFRRQAVAYRIAIMNHLISFFYDTASDTFTIPTDLPYLLPSKLDIQKYKRLLSTVDDVHVGISQGEQYFRTMFKECEQTLNKCR